MSALATGISASADPVRNEKPNFIIILSDDQGYNDLGCYGSQKIKTPNIDKMANEGLKLTSFYAQPVSGPSRGVLLTGRYPTRIGGGWTTKSEEITVAEILKTAGYRTGCIGKWDISRRRYQEGLIPNDQGFDYYFGTLGGNGSGIIQLYRNKEALNRTKDMSELTSMYTLEALKFIKENRDTSFFLYLAHTMPHVMIDALPEFKGKSEGGLYGDVIEELDFNVGKVLDLVRELGLDDNTYIVYASDNGPWSGIQDSVMKVHGGQIATGSAFPLRSSKGSPYEGGFRVPCIIRAPGRVPAGIIKDQMMSTLDILPTFVKLAGADLPEGVVIDGFDQTSFIHSINGKSARDSFHYHVRGEIQAVRKGKWKLLIPDTKNKFPYVYDKKIIEPELYNLENDISEKSNQAEKYPRIIKKLLRLAGEVPEDLMLR